MKRFISVLLAVILLALSALPALAEQSQDEPVYVNVDCRSDIPIVTVSGDGDPLYDTEGNKVLHYSSLLNLSDEVDEEKKESIKNSVMNVLYPFLVDGLLTNKWDKYYEALQKEVSELLEDSLLDENGEPSNGTSISPSRFESNEHSMRTDKKHNGTYGLHDYYFFYDWRLDPLATADKLNEYIKAVKEATGVEKVGILSRCLGTSVAVAYVAKYGMDDIQGVGFNGGVVNGGELISEPISGKFKLNPNAINRFLSDCNALGFFEVDEFITASIDLLEKNGIFDIATGVTKATVYYKLVEGVTSALALSTFFTWPCYWAAVTVEDYDDAIKYVFGEQGSEKRTKYAGLIEKLDNYNAVVRQKLPSLYRSIAENGNIGVMSKYGFQIGPICESCDEIGDQFASVYRSSYGAITSTVYGTLSDKYIESRVALGKGKYISPDKQVDASTCMFPDNTWFVKGSSHSEWTFVENGLLMEVVSADRQLTTDDFMYTQYMVFSYETSAMSPMTTENCDTYNWLADEKADKSPNLYDRIIAILKSFINWIRQALRVYEERQITTQAEQAV